MPSQVLDFEELITGCMSNSSIANNLPQPIVSDYPPFERYYDSKLPTIVTKELVTGSILLRNLEIIILNECLVFVISNRFYLSLKTD